MSVAVDCAPLFATQARLEVAQITTSSGPMLAAFTSRGLTALRRGKRRTAFAEALSRRFPRAAVIGVRSPSLERQLAEYFDGSRRAFEVGFDLDDLAAFNRRTLLAACDIPYGETLTYGELAAEIGHPGAGRAVGNALSRSPISVVIPCHRVVRAADGISGWGANLGEKRRLLALERHVIVIDARTSAPQRT